MDKVYFLAMKRESVEEPSEVSIRAFSTTDKALEAQEKAVEDELAERPDEKLTVERYEDEAEILIIDDNGGYVVFSVGELEIE